MARKDKKQPERQCPHVDVDQWETRSPGVTHDIVITWFRCRDCGERWNKPRNG